MRLSVLLSFILPYVFCVAAAAEEVEELVPVPRHAWDRAIQKRQAIPAAEASANVTLQDHEQLLWTTPPSELALLHEIED